MPYLPKGYGNYTFGVGLFVPHALQADFSEDATGTATPVLSTGGPGGVRTLYYQALFYVPAPVVAAAVAFVEGWQAPLSAAPKAATLALGLMGGAVLPPTPPPQVPQGWQQPLSIAAPARKAQQGGAVWVGQPLAGNNVDLGKWQQPLSIAAQRPPVQLGQAFVPFDTAQLAATPSILWQQPASVAPPRLSPPQSELRQFAVNVVAPAPEGWQAPLSRPVDRRPLLHPDFRQFTVTVEVAEAPALGWQQPTWRAVPPRPVYHPDLRPFGFERPFTDWGWYSPLSTAVPIPRAPLGYTFVPLNTAQVVAVAVYGWQQPLSVTPRKLPVAQTPLAPFAVDVEEDNTVTIDKWLVPLSKAAPIPRYQVGTTFVPLNTAQIVVAPSYGWFTPLSAAAPVPPVGPAGPSYVFLSTAFTQNTATYQGYQQPLSRAAPRPPVWQGQVAWVATPQAGNNVDISKWQQPLSRPVDRPPVWQGTALVPLDTAQVVVTPSYGWQQPLSVTPRKLPTAQTPLAPFAVDVAQIVSVTPEQFGWYAPLSTLASTKSPGQVAVTLLGWTFVPWDTVQVIPPPPVGGVQPPGYWYEQWERIAERQGKRKKPAPELIIAVDEIPADWQPSKVFKVSPRVIEALAQAKTVDDIRALARQETGQVRNMLNMVIAEHKRRMKDEDDIEIILLTWS